MREQDLILGGKSPEYDARGIWTGPHPAFEGWRPTEPHRPTPTGLGFTLIATALVAFIAAHMGG